MEERVLGVQGPRVPARRPGLWARLGHYARAIWAENIKEWKIELCYKADFARTLVDPVVFLLPYLLYGVALVGGRQSEHLKELVDFLPTQRSTDTLDAHNMRLLLNYSDSGAASTEGAAKRKNAMLALEKLSTGRCT